MFTFLQKTAHWGICLLVIAALTLTACENDSLLSPEPPANDLFTNYVALGNSITAGFQSDGINGQTQQASYAVLLAQQMGTSFTVPELNLPGCPPPLTNPLTGERVGGPGAPECALRATPPPRRINNTAVPGAAVLDALSNLDAESNANTLTTLILGGRTQVERAAEVNPTFASVWLGNNDVLGAALSGVVTEDNVTSPEVFQQRYSDVLDELEAAGAEGGVLIGVADVTLIPHLSVGAAYLDQEATINGFGAATSPAWGSFTVDASCSPAEVGLTTLVPFEYGFGELFGAALQGQDVELNCDSDETVLEASEIGLLGERIAQFNTGIEAEADARGWAFFDPNPIFQQLAAEGEIPAFPNPQDEELFGPIFSLDGVHPSTAAHELVAAEIAAEINATYGTNLAP